MIEINSDLIEEKINQMAAGSELGLADMFGEDWETLADSGQRKEFGKLFKAAVADNTIQGVTWVRIENSGRNDVYRKD